MMDMKTVNEIKTTILNQIAVFDKRLYGRDSVCVDEIQQMSVRINDVVDKAMLKAEDFDMWVFLKYRHGKKLSKKSFTKELEPVSLIDAITDGFDIPEEATLIEIEIRPVVYKKYDRNVLPNSVYSVRFALGMSEVENLTAAQLKRRHGIGPNENLFSIADLKSESKILNFYNSKKSKTKESSSGHSL